MNRIGLLVNPVAGLGGTVGLKGTDGADLARRARELGAVARAGQRAATALTALAVRRPVTVLTVAGDMGADAAAQAGLAATVVCDRSEPSTAADTRRAAVALVEAGAELILFAGGDGTARDLLAAIGDRHPVLGIPSGVKMHSAVHAVTARAAGEAAAAFLSGAAQPGPAEVMDRATNNTINTVLYGHLLVPRLPARVQRGKAASLPTGGIDPAGIAADLRATRQTGGVDVFGPGTTIGAVLKHFDVDLLAPTGITVVDDTGVPATDADLATLNRLTVDRPTRIVVSPIGGQGFVFGRGNQQLAPGLLRRAGRDNIVIISGEAKLAALGGAPLLVDTGDDEVDQLLHGYVPVVTGHDRRVMYRIGEP